MPDGKLRLLALGDSQTVGDGLTLDETWPAQLERELESATPGLGWEVLNAGLSGASTWHFARLLEHLDGEYELDGVVVALYVNDVTPDETVPVPRVETNTRGHRVAYVLKRSALFTALWQMQVPIRQKLNPTPGVGRETRILTGEHDPVVEGSWQELEANLGRMRDYAGARGLGLWVVVLPRRDQVARSLEARAYNDRALAAAERVGVPAVDVLPPMQVAYETHGARMFIPWDGHNTAIANDVIARTLAVPVAAWGVDRPGRAPRAVSAR